MNEVYPHESAIILTDSIYSAYGGDLDASTEAQRSAAYYISEYQISNYLSTFLLPTTITGTYNYDSFLVRSGYLELDHAYISNIGFIKFLDIQEQIYYTITGTANIYASLRDADRGIVNLHYVFGSCGCGTSLAYPYQLQIAYTAGLPTGTANRPTVLQALVTMAKVNLNEMVGYGNETSGDAGVLSFRSQDYSEQRFGLMKTDLGASAVSNYAAKLLRPLKKAKFIRAR